MYQRLSVSTKGNNSEKEFVNFLIRNSIHRNMYMIQNVSSISATSV